MRLPKEFQFNTREVFIRKEGEEVILSPRPEDWGDFFTEGYAEIRADLKTRGSVIGANDLLIAAHARSLDLTLITNNMAELSRVAGLALENWTEAP